MLVEVGNSPSFPLWHLIIRASRRKCLPSYHLPKFYFPIIPPQHFGFLLHRETASTTTEIMAAASVNRDNQSLSRKLFPVLLRIHYPPVTPPSSSHSTPSVVARQPFENGITLRTTITTVSALLEYLQDSNDPPCMAPLDVTEYLDPKSLHIVWKSELELEDTPLTDENIRTQMANVWLHGGGDRLVVHVKKQEGSQAGAGAERWNDERQQAEFNDRDEYTRQVRSTPAADTPDFRSPPAAATVASSRHDGRTGMEDDRFSNPSSRPLESGSSYNPVQSEMHTWGGASPTKAAPISSSAQAGSDTFDIPAARSDSQYSGFTREPDPGNNETGGAYTPGSGHSGEQQRRSVPRLPGFRKADGSWDSEAAARAGVGAATSSDSSFGQSRPARDRTAEFGVQHRPVRPPSPPLKQHVWSDDTLGDRPKNISLPAVPVKRSIFPLDPGAKPLSQSRWATEEDPVDFGNGRQMRGVQGQRGSFDNQNRARGENRSWGSSSQQRSQNWDPSPQQSSWNPSPTTNQSRSQNWDSGRQPSQQWEKPGQTGSQGQDANSWNPSPTTNQSRSQNWDSGRQPSQQWEKPGQNAGQGQGQGQGQGHDGGKMEEGGWDSGNKAEEGGWDNGGWDNGEWENKGGSSSKKRQKW